MTRLSALGKLAKEHDWLPWYRRKNYKGNLNEEEKRHLDSFRLEDEHPAAAYEDLPDEVQGYISELELAVYDAKKQGALAGAFALTGVAAFLFFSAYHELGWQSPFVTYAVGGAILVFGWVRCRLEWGKISDEFWPELKGKGAPFSRTHEKLQQYWEMSEIGRYRGRHKAGADDAD